MAPVDDRHLDEPVLRYVRRDLCPFRVGQTVAQALASLRSQGAGERLVYFYVLDPDDRVVGVIPTRRLLSAGPEEPVESLMVGGVATVPATATVREASEAFLHCRFLALPVVDGQGRLEGIVDVGLFTDRIADVIGGRTADDIFQLIGVRVAGTATPLRSFRNRIPWLSANLAGGIVAALLAGWYQALLEEAVVLALFIPVVLALSESVSMQAVSLTVQRLHSPAFDGRRVLGALGGEVATACLLGATCGGAVGLVAWLWKGSAPVALAIGGVIWISIVTACAFGVLLPTALRLLRRDPKVAAGPIVLAMADLATLLFYFNVAGMVLR